MKLNLNKNLHTRFLQEKKITTTNLQHRITRFKKMKQKRKKGNETIF